MKKILSYIKPYILLVIATVVFLLCQSAVDLNLPNLMSDIVNIGIQQNGIKDMAPEIISQKQLDVLKIFMNDQDVENINYAYIDYNDADLSVHQQRHYEKTYPGLKDEKTSILNPNKDFDQVAINMAIAKADYSLKTLMMDKDLSKLENSNLDIALSSISSQKIEDAKNTANSQTVDILNQNAIFFTKVFYNSLNADLAIIQNAYIIKVGIKMLIATLCLVAFAIAVGFCTSRLGTAIARDLRRDLFAKVSNFSSQEFDKFGTASLITRCTNDVVQVRTLFSMGLRTICYAPIMGIGGIIMALYKSPNMSWIIALAAIVIFCVVAVMFVVAVPKFKIMQKLVDKLNLVSRENLSGMMVVRAFANQEFEEERFDKANRDLANNNLFVYRAMAFMMPTMMLIMNTISVLIVWFGGHQIASATIQVGDMMAFIQYTMQIIMAFLMISMVFVVVPRAVVSANRIADVLNCDLSIKDIENPLKLSHRAKGLIEFNNVSFNYDGADEKVLENISFVAKPGETTAFIGSTGSGKSTLINLIPRFFDVSEGSITIDNMDIRKMSKKDLRDLIGYVPQKGVLFSGDIKSNLKYGDNLASDELLKEAADIAQASEFIDALDNGYDTEISQGGTNVSGGQRQRLSIARALVKKAPIYIFDDSFSALDFKTDAKLRKALFENTKDSTILIVAQRVSTIMNADQIIVLEEGKIVGKGRHEELMQNCETYREIAESQLSKEELM